MYKDVIHEDSLEIEGEKKAPDYAFRVGGTRKFFVEAKKPSVNIEMNIHPAFQLQRYPVPPISRCPLQGLRNPSGGLMKVSFYEYD